jgi:hypothetical protein
MKSLILLATALLATQASAASYGKKASGVRRSGVAQTRQVSRTAGTGASGSGAVAFKGGFGTRTLAGADVPGWNSNPQPGALIRTAGMGFKTSDGGGVRNSADYSAAAWADKILHVPQYAYYTSSVGVMQGPKDTPPYPANQGGTASGAGGNGLFAGAGLLGLNSQGQTVTVNGPGSGNGNH